MGNFCNATLNSLQLQPTDQLNWWVIDLINITNLDYIEILPADGALCPEMSYCGEGYKYIRGMNLRGMNLRGMNPRGMNLRGMNLRGMNLRGMNLRGTNLRGMNLRGMNLRGMNLRGMDIRGMNICDTSCNYSATRLNSKLI